MVHVKSPLILKVPRPLAPPLTRARSCGDRSGDHNPLEGRFQGALSPIPSMN